MPAIRLADIPNAGPRSVAASTAMTGVPSSPGLVIEPRVAQLGGAAMLDSQSIRRGAESMVTQTLELDAFSQEAGAAGKFAKAIQSIAGVAADWGQKFADAKDTADLARAETLMQTAREKQKTEQLSLPPEKWGENWTRNAELTKKALSEIRFSRNATDRLAPAYERWTALSALQIDNESQKQKIAGFRQDVEANFLMKAAAEDFDGAIAIVDESVAKQIHSAEEGTLLKARLTDNMTRKAKAERNAEAASFAIQNPIEADEDSAKALKSGKSEMFPWMDGADLVRYRESARREAANYRRDYNDATVDLVLSGQLSSERDIRNHTKGILPESDTQSILNIFSKTPAQIEMGMAARPAAYALASSYDPANDDQNMTEYFRIRDTILMLPAGETEEPLAILRKAKDGARDSTPMNVATDQLKEMFKAGEFGEWTENDEGKPADDGEWDKYLAAGKKFAGYKSALETWAKNNPRDAADQNKVYEHFTTLLSYDRELQRLQRERTRWRWPWEGAPPAAEPLPPITPSDVRRKLEETKSKSSKPSKGSLEEQIRQIDFETPLPEMSGAS
jgi:hypothetical protein